MVHSLNYLQMPLITTIQAPKYKFISINVIAVENDSILWYVVKLCLAYLHFPGTSPYFHARLCIYLTTAFPYFSSSAVLPSMPGAFPPFIIRLKMPLPYLLYSLAFSSALHHCSVLFHFFSPTITLPVFP